jgi:hypothetical protein
LKKKEKINNILLNLNKYKKKEFIYDVLIKKYQNNNKSIYINNFYE